MEVVGVVNTHPPLMGLLHTSSWSEQVSTYLVEKIWGCCSRSSTFSYIITFQIILRSALYLKLFKWKEQIWAALPFEDSTSTTKNNYKP